MNQKAYQGNFKAELETKLAPWDSSLTISHQLISHLILVPTGDAKPRGNSGMFQGEKGFSFNIAFIKKCTLWASLDPCLSTALTWHLSSEWLLRLSIGASFTLQLKVFQSLISVPWNTLSRAEDLQINFGNIKALPLTSDLLTPEINRKVRANFCPTCKCSG